MWIGHRTLEDGEEVLLSLLALDQGEQFLELVEDEHELGIVVRKDPLQRAQEAALAILELLDQTGRRLIGHSGEGRLELLERIGTREHLDDRPTLGARQRSPAQCRHEAGPHHGRLAAAARADNGEEAGLAQPFDDALGQRLAPEEVRDVGLLECAQTLVGIGRFQGLDCSAGKGTERSSKGDVLRQVFELGPDVDHVHAVGQILKPDRPALDVLDAVQLAREMRQLPAYQDLRRAGEAG